MSATPASEKESKLTFRLLALVVALIVCRAVDQVLYYRLANMLGELGIARAHGARPGGGGSRVGAQLASGSTLVP